MWCGKCDKNINECTCKDLDDRMRVVSGPDGYVACRWCEACDHYYVRCTCEVPQWVLRAGGQYHPLPEDIEENPN